MAVIAARGGHEVMLYARDKDQVAAINETHCNPKCLSSFKLLEAIVATSSIPGALNNAHLVILCLPAQIVPQWLQSNKETIRPDVLLCNTAKGLYLRDKKLMSEAVREALERDQPYAALSGLRFLRWFCLKNLDGIIHFL
jgi:glycerol-3-phosphate dehydrogenase